MASAISPSPVTSPYNLDLGPLLVPREVRVADLLLDIPEVSATTAALVNVVLEDRDQDTRPGTRPGGFLKLDHMVFKPNGVPLQVSQAAMRMSMLQRDRRAGRTGTSNQEQGQVGCQSLFIWSLNLS